MSLRTMSWAESVTDPTRRPPFSPPPPPHHYASRGGLRGPRSWAPPPPPQPHDDVSDQLANMNLCGDVSCGGAAEENAAVINFDAYEDIPVEASGDDVPAAARGFEDIDLGERLNENVRRSGYAKPTPVQRHAIPIALAGRDLMACAQTGSGKTAAFCFPIIRGVLLNNNMASESEGGDGWTVFPSALILSPTRELASQIYHEAIKFAYQSGAKVAVVYGGVPMSQQLRELERGVDILIATPGRLADMIERGRVSLKRIKYLALDEADRMLDMGFEPQIRKIVQRMDMPPPGVRQTLLFSATFPDEIQRLAADFLKNYIFLTVGKVGSSTDLIAQKVVFVRDMDKIQRLCGLLKNQRNGTNGKLSLTLVFVETKKGANQLENLLSRNGFPARAIHGDKVQMERERALRLFKCGTIPILVATDVASRGLDIPHVAHVINFDFPKSIDDYVHRIGRTGRAGKSGLATAFFSEKNQPLAKSLVELMKGAKQEVPDWLIDYAKQSSPYGEDQNLRYGGSSNFGGYDFRRSQNHYGSGIYGYGGSPVGMAAATFHGTSGSYAADSSAYASYNSASYNGGQSDAVGFAGSAAYGETYGISYVNDSTSYNGASYNDGVTDAVGTAGSSAYGGNYGNSYVDNAASYAGSSYTGGETAPVGHDGSSNFGNYENIVATGWE